MGREQMVPTWKMRLVTIPPEMVMLSLLQLAAMADVHFSVEKGERAGRTYTQVERLDRSRRKEELARLTSGEHITEATLDAAGELLDGAERYKQLHKS